MKNFISWEHYKADQDKKRVKEFLGFGLVFFGAIVLLGLAIIF